MKKLFYTLCSVVLVLLAGNARAQYTITTSNIGNSIDSICLPTDFNLQTSGFVSGLEIHTYYGDGTDDVNPVMSSFIGGYAHYAHDYSSPGTYTIKQVLTLSGAPIDSLISSYTTLYCQTFVIRAYNDANGDCAYDSTTENLILMPITMAVDSNGVRVDTFVVGSGLMYEAHGNPGDVYAFHVIGTPAGLSVTCPAGGVLYDTLSTIVNDYVIKDLGLQCTGGSGYDAAEYVSTRAGRHSFMANILLTNQYCSAMPMTFTMNMSPKYNLISAVPAPTSISGHTLTWTFPSISAVTPQAIYVHGEVPGAWLVAGDTVQSSYYVTPLAGDADTSNNTVVLVDTVTSSYDPNYKSVNPPSWIIPGPGTKLTYTIHFENTGNDTAFNIHVMDTLSSFLDVRTLALVGSTAPVNIGVQHVGLQDIVKFDFPHINLLDSSHHGQCDGFVMFTIKTKDGLPFGTQIHNQGGIYFDYNGVVMTNTTTNTIGIPTAITEVDEPAAGISLYPNPAGSDITISIEKGSYNTVTIMNSVGQQVLTQQFNGSTAKLNIRSFPAGSYFVTVRGKSGVQAKQFQKM